MASTGPPPRRLSDETLSDLLSSHSTGVFATVKRSGAPHLTTMIYHWDPAERIVRVFTTAERLKVRHVRNNPHAALHVPGPDVWSFAVAEGTAEVSDIASEPGDAIGREIWAMLPAGMRPADQDEFYASLVEEHRVVIRLHAERLYGAVLEQG